MIVIRTNARVAVVLGVVALGATTVSGCSRDDASAPGGKAPPAASSGASATSAGGRVASCDRVPTMSVCSEYTGAYLAQNEAVITSQCAKLGGTFVRAECPNTAVLGSCTLSTSEVRKFYASGAAEFDAPRAEKECTTSYKGKWAAFK